MMSAPDGSILSCVITCFVVLYYLRKQKTNKEVKHFDLLTVKLEA